jgi:putative endonuclease
MTNNSKTLYTGVTNDLNRRVYEHKQKIIPGFTQKYNITKLVYFEETSDVNTAIANGGILLAKVLQTDKQRCYN